MHALYLSPDSSKAVGVTRVSEELCEDHFVGNPVFRGFDEGEAIAQTLLLLMHFSGQISEGYTPRLGKSTISPKWPVVPPVDLNIVVEKLEDKEGPFAVSYDGLNTFSIVNLINLLSFWVST